MRYALALMLCLVGCVNAQPTLDQTAETERKIGDSAAAAFGAIAAVASTLGESSVALTGALGAVQSDVETARPLITALGPIASELAGVATDLHDSTTSIKGRLDGASMTPWLLYVLGAGIAMTFIHGVFSTWRLHRHLKAVHVAVKDSL